MTFALRPQILYYNKFKILVYLFILILVLELGCKTIIIDINKQNLYLKLVKIKSNFTNTFYLVDNLFKFEYV